ELRAVPEEEMIFVMVDPPLAGLPIELRAGEDGDLSIVIGEGTVEYTFTPETAGDGATPAATPAAAD
ncbi:MAG TPA: hypothetical protein VD789_09390, partial [Thermomicrobiales bacterium]|nr:hypothetical protein [Thermomicrobiales bacterium]